MDDDFDTWRAIKRSQTYGWIEAFLILYALFGNEIMMNILLSICQEHEVPSPAATLGHLLTPIIASWRPFYLPLIVPQWSLRRSPVVASFLPSAWKARGEAPLDPNAMDTAVGWANLVLFVFFLTDMTLQFCIHGCECTLRDQPKVGASHHAPQ